MRRIVFLFISILCAQIHAGIKTSGEPVRLVTTVETRFLHPVFSPDGSRLAFTSDQYFGLWLAQANGDDMEQISQDPGAGFGFQWSKDGNAIVTRISRYDGAMRLNAIKLFDLTTRTPRLLTGYQTSLTSLPQWAADDCTVLYLDQERLTAIATGRISATLSKQAATPQVFLQTDRLAMASGEEGSLRRIAGLEDLRAFNLTASPDGRRVAFEILGGPMCVMEANGSNLVRLGTGDAPQWSPDGQYLLYMVTTDDGHTITGSDLYVIRPDGSGAEKLTSTPTISEMHPAWSPDGGKIVYDVYESGHIEQLQVNID